MVKATHKCPKCPRTFGMPAHLARHMNTIHSTASKAKKVVKKAATGKRKVRRPKGVAKKRAVGRPKGGAASRSLLGDASRLVGDMKAYFASLMLEKAALDAKLEAVTTAMDALGGAAPAGKSAKKRGRPAKKKVGRPAKSVKPVGKAKGVRAGSLKDYIGRILGQRTTPMSPRDIGARVLKSGFKTKAKDLTKAVSNTLPTMKNVKRVGFGMYQLGR